MTTISLYGQPLVDPTRLLTTASFTTFALNASNNALAAFFMAENIAVHGAIVGFLYNCTAITSPPVYRFSLQGISSRGTPDGTVKGGGSPASVTLTPTVSQGLATFANPFTPSTGDLLALVVEYSSGTVGASNTATFASRLVNSGLSTSPYGGSETAGVWAVVAPIPTMAPVYSDGYIGRGFCPAQSVSNNLTLGVGYGSTWIPSVNSLFTGCVTSLRAASAGSTITLNLYEGSSTTVASTTVVSTLALNPDKYFQGTGIVLANIAMPAYTLQAGLTYRLTFTVTSVALGIAVSASFVSQAALQSFFGPLGGTVATSGTFADFISGTDWRAYPIIPTIDSYTTPSGGIVRPLNMNGGMAG